MKENQDVSNLKIQLFDKDQQQEQENLNNNNLQREKFEEEFYDFFKKEQQEIERKKAEQEEQRKRDFENHLREEREKQNREEEKKNNEKKYMDEIISLMRKGKSRNEAADQVGVKRYMVNDWYNKGRKRINGDYLLFYKTINEIESKNINSKNEIKCVNCGKYYEHDSKFCPHCGKPNIFSENVEVNYCENCGAKLTDEDLYFCINCGHQLYNNEVNNHINDDKLNNQNKNNDELSKFCMAFIGVFIIVSIISYIIDQIYLL